MLCHSEDLLRVVSLKPVPVATPEVREIPLNLNLCRDCGQLQVSHVPDAELHYGNFTYKTSLSSGLAKHFEAYASDLRRRYAPRRDGFVVEAGSSDGTLLRYFKDGGMRVLGIDPATAAARDANDAGIETLPEFFTRRLAEMLRRERGPCDVFIANFVTANLTEMADFAEGVRTLLAEDGVACVETQYGADVIEGNLLDTIYHEHLSYFMLTPLVRHYARHGLEVIDVERVLSKGGSIRLFLQLRGGPRKPEPAVAHMLSEEEQKGMFSPPYYAELPKWIERIRLQVTGIVAAERAAGRSVAGWGISVGTAALLPQLDLSDKIEFLVDDTPGKEPLLVGSGRSLPVVTIDEFYRRNPGAVIVFAWRYIKPIMEKHHRYLDAGGRFVVPLPHVSVVDAQHREAPNTIAV